MHIDQMIGETFFTGKKVLVTGGCGFIGSHIVDNLLAQGAEVVVLDNLVTGKVENISHHLSKSLMYRPLTFIQKDLRDDSALDEALDGVDFVSHQAALRSVPKSIEFPMDFNDVNVTGTLKLFLKCRDKGIKKIVFASSSSVYGDRLDFPERESVARLYHRTKPVPDFAGGSQVEWTHHFG